MSPGTTPPTDPTGAYYRENPDIWREHANEAWDSYIDDLMSEGMTKEEATEFARENPDR
jgi:hypothetical protein|tara:strand:+ start:333 stop:509 length:177 start_codon:yes stop_codon:yes gene_type:complete